MNSDGRKHSNTMHKKILIVHRSAFLASDAGQRLPLAGALLSYPTATASNTTVALTNSGGQQRTQPTHLSLQWHITTSHPGEHNQLTNKSGTSRCPLRKRTEPKRANTHELSRTFSLHTRYQVYAYLEYRYQVFICLVSSRG